MHESQGQQSQTGFPAAAKFDPAAITRPVPELMTYYVLVSLMTLAGFPFVILPFIFKYNTLRYSFDDKGVSMSFGWLFRKEIYLTYRRIQDIHVTRNFVQRWLGLASVAVQTASGSSGAEMTIEGITDPEGLRDFLYSKMRGAKEHHEIDGTAATLQAPVVASDDAALALLHEIRDELRALRTAQRSR